jgi:6-phospho-beta-glucosidase
MQYLKNQIPELKLDIYGKGSYKRYKKDSFDYYKQVIKSNGTNLNYSE